MCVRACVRVCLCVRVRLQPDLFPRLVGHELLFPKYSQDWYTSHCDQRAGCYTEAGHENPVTSVMTGQTCANGTKSSPQLSDHDAEGGPCR